MAGVNGYTRQEHAVIGIAAEFFRRKPKEFTPDSEVEGYRFTSFVKERLGCPTMINAPRITIREVAGWVPAECLNGNGPRKGKG